MFRINPDEAVSPVIGVVLMVAITVILAAMIASIVMGMTTNIQQTKVVTAKVSQLDEGTIIAVYYGGTDEKSCAGYGGMSATPWGVLRQPKWELSIQ
jgi:flagellin-like protein